MLYVYTHNYEQHKV